MPRSPVRVGKGATVNQDAREAHGSRNATIVDPFGHRWMLSGPVTGASVPIQHGDVGYVSVWTPDADRAAAFYGHVLGWTYDRWFCAYFSRSVSCSPPTCAVWVVAATGIHTRAGGHRRRRESGEAERE